MEFPIDPVEFWLVSPSHREIILNPLATDVGIGFSINYGAASVWYWTAEFASRDLPAINLPEPPPSTGGFPEVPMEIQLLGPPQDSEFVLAQDNNLIFTWGWPEYLGENQRFSVYIIAGFREVQIGALNGPLDSSQFQLTVPIGDLPVSPGTFDWQVRLMDLSQSGESIESQSWPIRFVNPSTTPG
jgi:hypothetical protein